MNLSQALYSEASNGLPSPPWPSPCSGWYGLHLPPLVATNSFLNTFPPASAPDTLASLLFCSQAWHVPTSGHLCLLFLLPGKFSPKYRSGLLPFFLQIFVQLPLFSTGSSLPSRVPHICYVPENCFLLQEPASLRLRAFSSPLLTTSMHCLI